MSGEIERQRKKRSRATTITTPKQTNKQTHIAVLQREQQLQEEEEKTGA